MAPLPTTPSNDLSTSLPTRWQTLYETYFKGEEVEIDGFIFPKYSWLEEVANTITHGLGAAGGVVVSLFLWLWLGGSPQATPNHWTAFTIYGVSMVVLYSMSTLYHFFQRPRLKKMFQILDHACIYLLIAATYTPFVMLAVQSQRGWLVLGGVWTAAVLGMGLKVLFFGRFTKLFIVGYVIMGWLCLVAWDDMFIFLTPFTLVFLAAGGLSYMIGLFFFALERVNFNHAIWHAFVVLGSFCHFVAMWPLLP